MKIILAHRGNYKKYPENSLVSFNEALNDINYNGIETDIRISKDGIFYCFHDDDIENLTNGNGNINELDWCDINKLKLKDSKSVLTNYKIPKLETLFILNTIYNKILNLEIKTNPNLIDINSYITQLITLAKKYNMLNKIIISSFYYEYYSFCKTNKLNFGFLIHNDELYKLYLELPSILILDKEIDSEILNSLYKKNYLLGVYTLYNTDNIDLSKFTIEIRE